MIEVSEVVNAAEFAQSFSIIRSTGSWVSGVWTSVTTTIAGYGTIANPTNRELEMVSEGDKVKGVMVFWSSQPIYATRATEGVGSSSDILVWRGLNFRVLDVKQFQDYQYYRATAVRMKAD